MKKQILIILILIGLACLSYGYYMYNKPVGSIEKLTPDFELSANELLESYEVDEDAANSKYLDKIIQVKGKVDKIEEGEESSSIYLQTESPLSNIICELEAGQDIGTLKEGDDLIIKGQCTGYLMDVVLVRSIII